jgi:hypothetical protein
MHVHTHTHTTTYDTEATHTGHKQKPHTPTLVYRHLFTGICLQASVYRHLFTGICVTHICLQASVYKHLFTMLQTVQHDCSNTKNRHANATHKFRRMYLRYHGTEPRCTDTSGTRTHDVGAAPIGSMQHHIQRTSTHASINIHMHAFRNKPLDAQCNTSTHAIQLTRHLVHTRAPPHTTTQPITP